MRRPHVPSEHDRAGAASWRATIAAAAVCAALVLTGAASASGAANHVGAGSQPTASDRPGAPTAPAACQTGSRRTADVSPCSAALQREHREQDERMTCMIHERHREDARCAAEVLTKLAYAAALVVASATGVPQEVLEALKAIASR